jgi:hypothetical protein
MEPMTVHQTPHEKPSTRKTLARCVLALMLAFFILPLTGCQSGGISPLAVRSDRGNYVGRYIGGGKHFGQARHRHEGIWARDYAGLDLFHIIELRWSHSQRHHQGGLDIY